jgi:hypothetical protein
MLATYLFQKNLLIVLEQIAVGRVFGYSLLNSTGGFHQNFLLLTPNFFFACVGVFNFFLSFLGN